MIILFCHHFHEAFDIFDDLTYKIHELFEAILKKDYKTLFYLSCKYCRLEDTIWWKVPWVYILPHRGWAIERVIEKRKWITSTYLWSILWYECDIIYWKEKTSLLKWLQKWPYVDEYEYYQSLACWVSFKINIFTKWVNKNGSK